MHLDDQMLNLKKAIKRTLLSDNSFLEKLCKTDVVCVCTYMYIMVIFGK